MKTISAPLISLFPLLLSVVLASCENSGSSSPDARNPTDAQTGDAGNSADARQSDAGNPADTPPVLGAQIDRAGRAAINPLLNGVFQKDLGKKGAQQDAYRTAAVASDWATSQIATNLSIAQEFAANIGIYDALDFGYTKVTNGGCGNAALYVLPIMANSYFNSGSLLADDQLYVDTSNANCSLYLSLELEAAGMGRYGHRDCGGRAPTFDVSDNSYSFLAMGFFGFDTADGFSPLLTDGVAAHTDVSDTVFPFFGPPH
jgi:hypothetical protein